MKVHNINLVHVEFYGNALSDKQSGDISIAVRREYHISDDKKYLTVILGLKTTDDEAAPFSFRIEYAGLFFIEKDDQKRIEEIGQKDAPEMMLPYLRETATSLLLKSGFPPIDIPSLNFDNIQFPSQED
ncbi:protein-export chaperone SecB [Halodesulfovibrio spirochaetisodalis]|uniref:Preprotein translocase subunit SecB n=1 Tax=Halodesulfovibrio spirochaetisodalis TaxID=1560234 RepID=A0A1B7XA58_9BACT|nr:protein-export chaperone SecB [Halodesulfovibrio spirochaetisodalis]OBQ46236.1 hypothetical protein SP90_13650 [Halodesulfovibrio spirochaetisodalis]